MKLKRDGMKFIILSIFFWLYQSVAVLHIILRVIHVTLMNYEYIHGNSHFILTGCARNHKSRSKKDDNFLSILIKIFNIYLILH